MNGEREFLLKALREAGDQLLEELLELGEAALAFRPSPDEWSLKEVLGHLRDVQALALEQVQAALAGRPLPHRDIDPLPQERGYQDEDAGDLLEEMASLRRRLLHLLWSLTDEEWHRPCHHPLRGDLTVTQVVRELAQHDLEHLWQVRRLKALLEEPDLDVL
ncbi:MAG: DinB family protein [Dehalococcoidia bacterium]|nr:DinB family protein [Dehalococcoidia bacterium]MDW8008909.1 DinB family protein [Chloroflexota bacterium]